MVLDLMFGAAAEAGHLRGMTAMSISRDPASVQGVAGHGRQGAVDGVRERELPHRQGRVRLHHRPLGLRQDDHPQRHRRPRAADVRRAWSWTAARSAAPSLDRGVVFQSHALMPWMSVMKNIAFAVKSRWPDWSGEKIALALPDLHRPRGPHRRRAQEALRTLRRHEAARRHRPRLRHPAEDAAARRAVRRARRADARHDPGRAAQDRRRPRTRRCS